MVIIIIILKRQIKKKLSKFTCFSNEKKSGNQFECYIWIEIFFYFLNCRYKSVLLLLLQVVDTLIFFVKFSFDKKSPSSDRKIEIFRSVKNSKVTSFIHQSKHTYKNHIFHFHFKMNFLNQKQSWSEKSKSKKKPKNN